jgi:hypothetical protein
VGYKRIAGLVVPSTDTDVSWKLGGGGFISNIDDLAAYAAGLINRRLVREATEAAMWTPQRTADGAATTMGLGFSVKNDDGVLEISHNGSQEKTRTRMVIYPRQRHGVVVMSNSEYADPATFAQRVYAAMEGVELEPIVAADRAAISR